VKESTARIGLVFPELLGTYGDRGNAVALCSRLRRRGVPAELVDVRAGEPIPRTLDCYVIGGGEDHAERTAAALLRQSDLAGAYTGGAVIVAVCAGFQLLGTSIRDGDGHTFAGLGIIDASTAPDLERRVGDAVVDGPPTVGAVCGFENHAGATIVHSGPPPLGTIRGDGRAEGVFGRNLLATYLHGPVLVRNPALADAVLEWFVGELPELADDHLATALHDGLVARFSSPRTRWSRRRSR